MKAKRKFGDGGEVRKYPDTLIKRFGRNMEENSNRESHKYVTASTGAGQMEDKNVWIDFTNPDVKQRAVVEAKKARLNRKEAEDEGERYAKGGVVKLKSGGKVMKDEKESKKEIAREKKMPWLEKGEKKFRKGGAVKAFAKGGMVRSGGHGDGCAQRGRTKGRMV